MSKNRIVLALLVLLAGCAGRPQEGASVPPMDPARKVSEQECARTTGTDGGNLKCREVSEAEIRARIAEEERQARAKKEAAERERLERERAERERLERERAEALAREEAARKAREAEAARLAAERRRLEEEAARKAQEERERKEKAEAEARARKEAAERAEREKREAAAAECRRLEHERLEGRAALENFVATYGKDDEFKGIAGQINAFLGKPRKAKPCPSA